MFENQRKNHARYADGPNHKFYKIDALTTEGNLMC